MLSEYIMTWVFAAAALAAAAGIVFLIRSGPKDSGTAVRSIQRRLRDLGYPVGNVDGSWGTQTQVAVNLFYDAIHLRERSYMTEYIQQKLFAASAPEYDKYLPLRKGDQGLSVTYMQQQLRRLGYDPVKIDGIYGTMTIQAVAEYQEAIGYEWAPGEIPGELASRNLLKTLYADTPQPRGHSEPVDDPEEKETGVLVDNGYYEISGDHAVLTGTDDETLKGLEIQNHVEINQHKYAVTTIADGALAGMEWLVAVSGGGNITTIGKDAFLGCTSLEEIPTFGKLQIIKDEAFRDCSALRSVELGGKVKAIGKRAFDGCDSLKKIVIRTNQLTDGKVGSHAFRGIPGKAVIRCPEEKLETYREMLIQKGVPEEAEFKEI